MSAWKTPPLKVGWLQVTDRSQEVLCVSRASEWVSHWDPELRRSIRCGGRSCYPCSLGVQRQLRVVVMVVTATGEDKLLELRERHRERFDAYETMVGLRLRVRKAGTAKNSPVDIAVRSQDLAVERDISRLVEQLGLPPILVRAEEPALVSVEPETWGMQRDPFSGSGEPTRST